MFFSDVKDKESFWQFIDEVEAWLKLRNAYIIRLFERGQITEEEKLRMRTVIRGVVTCSDEFMRLLMIPANHEHYCSETELEEICNRLTVAAGLKSIYVEEECYNSTFDSDLFDLFPANGQYEYIKNGFEELDELWEDQNPRGKVFHLIILMKKGHDMVRIPYELTVDEAENTIDEKDGSRCLKVDGFGRFPGYNGALHLSVKKIDGKLCSEADQKMYLEFSETPEKRMMEYWMNAEAKDYEGIDYEQCLDLCWNKKCVSSSCIYTTKVNLEEDGAWWKDKKNEEEMLLFLQETEK